MIDEHHIYKQGQVMGKFKTLLILSELLKSGKIEEMQDYIRQGVIITHEELGNNKNNKSGDPEESPKK